MFRRNLLLTVLATTSALAVVSTAEASRARLLSLGQDRNGSLYIDDTRSVFLNPAMLNKTGPFANFEFGATATTPTVPAGTTVLARPAYAEGGAFIQAGNLRMGAQLGRETLAGRFVEGINAIAGTTLRPPENTFELVVAGGGPMNWGASVIYGNSELQTAAGGGTTLKSKANTLELRGGVQQDRLQGYGVLQLMSKSENETAPGTFEKYEGKPGLEVGGSFDLTPDNKIYGNLGFLSMAVKPAAAGSDTDGSSNYINAGIAHFLTPEAATRFFLSGGLSFSADTIKGQGGAQDTKLEQLYIPVALGLENITNDWLTLRASVTQRVLIDQTKTASVTNNNAPNSTVVAGGAGIKFKRLILDGVIGGSTNGQINAGNLFVQSGLTYMF